MGYGVGGEEGVPEEIDCGVVCQEGHPCVWEHAG